ncbi:MAG: ABC transporter ATP-binding protein [Dehalococcoidia bacterium]
MTAAQIRVKDVSRTFRLGSEDIHALRGVSLNVEPREFLALVGRSGSGKTTLMNIIAGLDRPSTGEVWVDEMRLDQLGEKDLTKLRRGQFGFIFQSFGLLPLLSAQENVELPMRIAGYGHGERVRRAKAALDAVGLNRRSHHRPYELSGGEQQRVAIARAIATEPRLILADEPTGELDSTTAKAVFTLLRTLAREHSFTVVTCTHDRLVMEMADRVEELVDGQIVTSEHSVVWKRAQEQERSPFEAAFVGAKHGGEEAAGGLSSLVGADSAVFIRPKLDRQASRSAATAGEDGHDAPSSDEASLWARPDRKE